MAAKTKAKKTTKSKGNGKSNIASWEACGIGKCRRKLADMARHRSQHRSGQLDDTGKRTDRGSRKGAAKGGKKAAKGGKAKKSAGKAVKRTTKKAPAEAGAAAE